ncbi:hypothetical protein BT93_H3134 [Corymbia citriodora subsp. variegata]|nr:hypothetical protein BT93_H3134 [Corymbia citriodora subsp. variegata]
MSLQDQKLRSVRSHSMETATESGYHLISAEELPTEVDEEMVLERLFIRTATSCLQFHKHDISG